jgi:hypothetical protein
MSRSLTLPLDAFGSEALAEFAERQGGSVSRVTTLAARYYLADDARPPGWRVPSSARNVKRERSHAGVRVDVDHATWNALLDEAQRQGVEVGGLAAHAVLYFMADFDSGRVAQRMADVVPERPR